MLTRFDQTPRLTLFPVIRNLLAHFGLTRSLHRCMYDMDDGCGVNDSYYCNDREGFSDPLSSELVSLGRMPRLRQAVQRLRSSWAVYSTDYTSAVRSVIRNSALMSSGSEQRSSFFSGAACRNLSRHTVRVHVYGCSLEENIKDRAGWNSYAERPRCRVHLSAGSGVDPSPEAEDIINQTHDLSDLDIDKRCIHPGLQIEEEILLQHDVRPLEQPVILTAELVPSVEQESEIADEQGVVGDAEGVLAGNDGAIVSSSVNIQGHKYLHVLSVGEVREVLEKARAKDMELIHVKGFCEWTDYIVIASGRSTRHLRGMADAIVYKVKQLSRNVGPNLYPLVEGREAEQWMTVDLGNIAIHLFLEEARSYYNLEELWRKKRSPPVEN